MFLKGAYKRIEPASGAIVMANGIFLIGAVEAFPLLSIQWGKILAFLLLIVWLIIYSFLSVQFFHEEFLLPFLKHPVQSFAIGTWIAGVSVLCNVFLKYFPKMLVITQGIAILNTFLFLLFLVTILFNFKQLLKNYPDYPIRGIVLISTVGTQSIIVLLNNVFFTLPIIISYSVIILGLIFYGMGVALIARSYMKEKGWTLVDDWANTNCIIHGALSITGLAIVSSNTFSVTFVTWLWFLILFLIVIAEVIELTRGILRIKLYGLDKGLFTYHISQWSRNFTFGMFYTFTLYMHKNSYYSISEELLVFQNRFLDFWAWIVLIALCGQIFVYTKYRLSKKSDIITYVN